MIPAVIEGCTLVLGAPAGWDTEKNGTCGGLPVRHETSGSLPVMISAWELTPAEIDAIARGAKVHLRVVGTAHPPVMLYVGEVP